MLCCSSSLLAQAAPQLVAAASRKSHAGASYDVALPLAGASGIECRSTGGALTIVLQFDKPVTAGNAAVVGNANVNGTPAFAGNVMTINLAGVTNAQELTVNATNVLGGGDAANVSVKVRALLGDINASGAVSGSDVNLCMSQVGFPVAGGNARSDANLSNSISGADVNMIRAAVGTSVAGGASANTVPSIGDIADQAGESGAATAAIGFAIADPELPADNLALTAKSSNPALLPVANVIFGGSGPNRTLSLTPTSGQIGTSTITITVSDGLATASDTFVITVTAPTKLYVATLRPQGAAISQASGSATLRLAGDELSASVRTDYSNLSSPKVAAHVHGPADPVANTSAGILFDLDVDQQPDGSFLWTFPSDATSRAAMVNAIKAGQTYINIHSSKYPDGEIKGFYALANGSITFKKPADPPPLPTDPPTPQDAARFLTQATFGPTEAEIANVQAIGYDAWIDQQIAIPGPTTAPTSQPTGTATESLRLKPTIDARIAAG
ncbi:MAG: CHRD domain-containing protein, partial [Tepidisphaeraceae bacterium]